MTDDIAQWLGARLDEDERIARAAHVPNWSTDGRRGVYYGVEDSWMTDALTTADADHIAAHDPARVLREIDAKRQLVERHERAMENRRAHPEDLASAGALLALHGAVKLLALPYADRPGYREEWRP